MSLVKEKLPIQVKQICTFLWYVTVLIVFLPGINGFKGQTGLPGEVGFDGPFGLKGEKGDHGDYGHDSEKGYRGDKGFKGIPGIKGRDVRFREITS